MTFTCDDATTASRPAPSICLCNRPRFSSPARSRRARSKTARAPSVPVGAGIETPISTTDALYVGSMRGVKLGQHGDPASRPRLLESSLTGHRDPQAHVRRDQMVRVLCRRVDVELNPVDGAREDAFLGCVV